MISAGVPSSRSSGLQAIKPATVMRIEIISVSVATVLTAAAARLHPWRPSPPLRNHHRRPDDRPIRKRLMMLITGVLAETAARALALMNRPTMDGVRQVYKTGSRWSRAGLGW